MGTVKLVGNPGWSPDMQALKNDLRLAFEPPQGEHHHRSTFLALKRGGQLVLDYIQRARHLASCVIADPIDTATQVHVFVTGMNAGHQRFYLTWKPPASLEEVFIIALRGDFSVIASRMNHSSPPLAAHAPEPMEIDAIKHATGQRRAPIQAFEVLRQRRTWSVSAVVNLVIARSFASRLLLCLLSPSRTFPSRSPGSQKTKRTSKRGAPY